MCLFEREEHVHMCLSGESGRSPLNVKPATHHPTTLETMTSVETKSPTLTKTKSQVLDHPGASIFFLWLEYLIVHNYIIIDRVGFMLALMLFVFYVK